MAYTQADLDAVDAYLVGGAETVRFADGREIRRPHWSMDDWLKLRNLIASAVGAATGQPATRQVQIYTEKGY